MRRAAMIVVALFAVHAFAGEPMRKQDALPTLYGEAVRIDEEWFSEWFAKQPEVKVPFTIWRQPTRVGAVGVLSKQPKDVLRFNDSALGISLDERLNKLCANEDPCRVWLAGRLEASEFNVIAVFEHVRGPGPYRSQTPRGERCLAIRKLPPMHCAKGATRCPKCKSASKLPATAKLLDKCPREDRALPSMELRLGSLPAVLAYDVLRTFKDDAEATEFAQQYGLTDVEL